MSPRAPFAIHSLLVSGMAIAACTAATEDSHPRDAVTSHINTGRDSGAPVEDGGARRADGDAATNSGLLPINCSDQSSLALYQERIEPLFEDDRPSTCSECHLSGLDLSLFLRPTPCETMACLIDQGLVDEADPEHSTILSWITRAKPQSELITQQIIDEEYAGFRDWIRYNVECEECADTACNFTEGGAFCESELEPVATYDPAEADPGDCEDETLLELFTNTIYITRGRCSPCHVNNYPEDKYEAPQWLDVQGDCESASRRTLLNIESRGLIDWQSPMDSLIIKKPLAEEFGGVEHGGHDKFYDPKTDVAYKNFTYFVERYTECRSAGSDE
jgi:hypothetical protein